MEKAGHSTFTKVKVSDDVPYLGKSLHVTFDDFKFLLNDAMQNQPKEL